MLMSAEVHVSNHPLLLHQLTLLRDRNTAPPLFRQLVAEMARLLFYEATRDLPLRPRVVQTPLTETTGHELAEAIALVPILRAGLGMAEALVAVTPTAQVWHVGLYRDHATHQPVRYYCNPPTQRDVGVALLVDPMLATGGSAVAGVDVLKEWGVRRIKYLGLIAAPEGVRALQQAHPDVPLHLAAIDDRLNESAYIVPGLGDAGDRQFGTS
jgi:uracil phosphoribosyltransferase